MRIVTLDCKGLACPGPVLRCKDCLETENPPAVSVVVDNMAARENVMRFLKMKGYEPSVTQDGDNWIVSGALAADASNPPLATPAPQSPEADASEEPGTSRVVAFIAAETIGRGDDELGGKLMINFLATLPELGSSLWRVILVNGGVRLAVTGHPALEKLRALADAGVDILVCGTCLDFFGLLEKKVLGQTTNMLDVVTSLQLADKVIRA